MAFVCLSCRPYRAHIEGGVMGCQSFARQDIKDSLDSFLENRQLFDEKASLDYLGIFCFKSQKDTLIRFLLSDDLGEVLSDDYIYVGSLPYKDCEIYLCFQGSIRQIDGIKNACFDGKRLDSLQRKRMMDTSTKHVHGMERVYRYNSNCLLSLVRAYQYNL